MDMKILIAPDSLKGSLTAVEFCHIVAEQIQLVRADIELKLIPLADGGEGTIEAILANSTGQSITIDVQNPLGQRVSASYAILELQQTAVIEMSQASGLPLLENSERNPLKTSSYGTGELIRHALDQGCRRFIIGLGGSATNDAGTGMLQALGAKFFDAQQQLIQASGQSLNDIEQIDLSDFDPRIHESEIIIAGDVTNTLCGEHGATYVYGPQKGADKQMLIELESGMKHFADKTAALFHTNADTDFSVADSPGTGAAGGMGYALMAYCQASMQSGFELIADLARLDEIIAADKTRPDIIITGEGRFDSQSIQGKLVGRLGERADQYNIPLIIICGGIGDDLEMNKISPNMSAFSICQAPISLQYAMNNSAELLAKLISNLIKVILIKNK